jgi:hypothetical protein
MGPRAHSHDRATETLSALLACGAHWRHYSNHKSEARTSQDSHPISLWGTEWESSASGDGHGGWGGKAFRVHEVAVLPGTGEGDLRGESPCICALISCRGCPGVGWHLSRWAPRFSPIIMEF